MIQSPTRCPVRHLVSAGPLVPSPTPGAQIEPGTEQVEKALGDALVDVEIGTTTARRSCASSTRTATAAPPSNGASKCVRSTDCAVAAAAYTVGREISYAWLNAIFEPSSGLSGRKSCQSGAAERFAGGSRQTRGCRDRHPIRWWTCGPYATLCVFGRKPGRLAGFQGGRAGEALFTWWHHAEARREGRGARIAGCISERLALSAIVSGTRSGD